MAFPNDETDSITWPAGASVGNMRMVVGADAPHELQLYGITVAMLFYVTKFETGVELGYFFIALSNTLDTNNCEACLFGSVRYPTPGDPTSPVMSTVKTHFQMSWDIDGTGLDYTVIKDKNYVFNASVPQVVSNAVQHFFYGDLFQISSGSLLIDDTTTTVRTATRLIELTMQSIYGPALSGVINLPAAPAAPVNLGQLTQYSGVPTGGLKYKALATVDFRQAVAGNNVGVASLYVNGVQNTQSQCIFSGQTAGARATCFQQWRDVALPDGAGKVVFELRANVVGVAASIVVNPGHTVLDVSPYFSNP